MKYLPMNSAPKDGTEFLVDIWCKDTANTVCWFVGDCLKCMDHDIIEYWIDREDDIWPDGWLPIK